MKIVHKEAPFDHYETEPEINTTNNIIIGITLGIVVALCAGVVWVVTALDAVSY